MNSPVDNKTLFETVSETPVHEINTLDDEAHKWYEHQDTLSPLFAGFQLWIRYGSESDLAQQYGVVELDGERVSKLIEQPREGEYRLMNGSVYTFGPSIFSEIEQTPQTEGERGLMDTVVQLIERSDNVRGVHTDSHRIEVTYPRDPLELFSTLLDSGGLDCPERTDGVYVHDRAMVHEEAVLRPPVVVRPETVVERGTVVGLDVALGRNATVGAGATLCRCVIDDDTRIGRNATLLGTVTGTDAEVAAGVTALSWDRVRINTTIYESEQLARSSPTVPRSAAASRSSRVC